jgi:REP element-mobilizing transposase RayT
LNSRNADSHLPENPSLHAALRFVFSTGGSILTRPRRYLPNETHFATVRMARQEFWLRPSVTINQIVGYCYGYAQEKYGMLIHQLTVMSNHIHITVTDPTGDRLSEFFSCAHSMIARCVNAH